MKSRELQKKLGTDRTIHAKDRRICIASMNCSDLLSLNIDTSEVKYALGGLPTGSELCHLSAELSMLSKEDIDYYWQGADDIENPITVYSVNEQGDTIVSITDSLEFPSATSEGELMYENTHFSSADAAIKNAISNNEAALVFFNSDLIQARMRVVECEQAIEKYNKTVANLKQQHNALQSEESKIE